MTSSMIVPAPLSAPQNTANHSNIFLCCSMLLFLKRVGTVTLFSISRRQKMLKHPPWFWPFSSNVTGERRETLLELLTARQLNELPYWCRKKTRRPTHQNTRGDTVTQSEWTIIGPAGPPFSFLFHLLT